MFERPRRQRLALLAPPPDPAPPHGPSAAPRALDGQDELACLEPAFARSLMEDFDLAALSARLCPVALEDGTAAIFALADDAAGDLAAELGRMLAARGYRLADPAVYVLPAPLLLAVARGQLTSHALRRRRTVLADPRKSGLASAFHELVAWGVHNGASDLHLNIRSRQAESEVRYTIGGRYLTPERFRRMPTSTLAEIAAVAWMDVRGGNGAVFDPEVEQQGRILQQVDGRSVMLRWASLATDAGPSVCLRILRLDAPVGGDLAALGYLPGQVQAMERACLSEGGAVVLAGVVGSGKSTTIAAMMHAIPGTRKVVTLEDPVEYLIPDALQNTVGRRLDASEGAPFDAKLKTIKRSAMNDLLIGEIRDVQSGRAFMDLAGSGISLYTTVHAGSALAIGDRLASDFIGVPRSFLAAPGILKLLVYQSLLPRLCPRCALPLDALFSGAPDARGVPREGGWWRDWVARIRRLYDLELAGLRVRNPQGCPACATPQLPQLNGTQGRTVAAELVEPGRDEAFLEGLLRGDALGLRRRHAARRRAAYDDPDMEGKTAMECAVYKMSRGEIDPRDVEPRFRAYATVELERDAHGGRHA